MVVMHLLFDYAVGYSLYRVMQFEDVGGMIPQVEEAAKDGAKFMKAVKMVAFRPFESAQESLENINAVTEGLMTPVLEAFLASNSFTKSNTECGVLGVSCPVLAQAIKEATGTKVQHKGIVPELVRGVRLYLPKFIQGLSYASMKQAALGLGHAYSRSKLKFNVNRVDNNIIQSIAINDQMDKDINLFAMRMREWYSYHFPELSRIVEDHHQYAQVVKVIKDRASLNEDKLDALTEILHDDNKAQDIISAARMSMGTEINEADLSNIIMFTDRVLGITSFRKNMTGYLHKTMNNVAPNLGVLIGDQVAARLISRAGSLTNLAKMPASTVQILGAEKALFRALKTKGNTPKYGLLYNSTFIGRASTKDKGRISRFLANKCSAASRIDCFSECLSTKFGEVLRQQVDDRLKFYETGDIPRKNIEVMAEALVEHNLIAEKVEKARKKRKREQQSDDTINQLNGHDETLNIEGEPPMKKSKKNKKKKKEANADESQMEESQLEESQMEGSRREESQLEEEPTAAVDESISKKKKKKKKNRESV